MAKPRPGTDWESWVDAVIRQSQERGEFDDLPGAGKPIAGLDKPHDDLWWVRKKLKEEEVSYLPPTLALRKEKEETLAAIETLRAEERVREVLEQLNEKIRTVNRRPVAGPPSTVVPVEVDEVVTGWRERQAARAASLPSPGGDFEPSSTTARPSRPLWRRLVGRRRAG